MVSKMNDKKYCIRCKGERIEAGEIYEYDSTINKDLMHFHWKNRLDSVPVNSVICMDCGHIELIGNLGSIALGGPSKCPHCNAVFSYSEDQIIEGSVRCQNCNKEFSVVKPAPSVLEEIEKDLLEE